MQFPSLLLNALTLALYGASPVLSQNLTEKVWAVFAYSVQGESTPSTFSRPITLTSYGADGLFATGSAFRDRYIAVSVGARPLNLRIHNLSQYILRSDDVSIIVPADQPAIASAQAFMQGLYPPLDTSHGAPYIEAGAQLANGSWAKSPLHGYQYPPIVTLGFSDPQSIVVAGQAECFMYQALVSEYNSSEDARRISRESRPLYDRLYDHTLAGVYERSSVDYGNACEVSEYLDYQSVHDGSLLDGLTQADIDQARWYADRYTFATNGDMSSTGVLQLRGILPDGELRTIAGQTLASHVLSFFDVNVQQRGSHNLMGFAFGGYEPAVALAALMGLASPKTARFYSRPVHGASLVFELFSVENRKYPKYPGPSDLFVRFLLRNGTNSSTPFTPYPLFGHSPSNVAIPLSEFRLEMKKVALRSTQDWCHRCGSTTVFCSGVVKATDKLIGGDSSINPTVAGVIGAVVTFVSLAIMVIIGLLVCGNHLRLHPKSGLGGFKGDGKMPSDSNLTYQGLNWGDKTKGSRGAGNDSLWGFADRDHEHSGSWEMVQQRQLHRARLQEEDKEEWQMHSVVEPAKVREGV